MTAEIQVTQLIGTPFCVASEDGARLYDTIFQHLKANEPVNVSFSGVTRMTTAFLNAGIGQAYNEFTEEHIRKYLHVSSMDEKGTSLLRRVVERAKLFFAARKNT
jgi:STAS-like domain of unknown function (DUF4325)